MAESKSGRTFNEINAHSEKDTNFTPKCIKRLAAENRARGLSGRLASPLN
jgi:hypothetical protein